MAKILNLPSYFDGRGRLTVVDDFNFFSIQRVYYIYDVQGSRGGHRHRKTVQALICVKGQCDITIYNDNTQEVFQLRDPEQCLIVYPEDWHTMDNFSEDAVLLVLASEHYDKSDYIYER